MFVKLLDVVREDLPLVERWLRADHVRRYWGDPMENSRLLREPTGGMHRALIAVGERKAGLVVWQHPTRNELDTAGLFDVPESVIDIDIMIGEPDTVGKGAGSAAIRLVADKVLSDPSVPFVIAATSTGNSASRRAFTRAGFVEDREFDDVPNGRHVLMVRRRNAPVDA